MRISVTQEDIDEAEKDFGRRDPISIRFKKMYPHRSCAVGVYTMMVNGLTYDIPEDVKIWIRNYYNGHERVRPIEFELNEPARKQ